MAHSSPLPSFRARLIRSSEEIRDEKMDREYLKIDAVFLQSLVINLGEVLSVRLQLMVRLCHLRLPLMEDVLVFLDAVRSICQFSRLEEFLPHRLS
jgi:hypothetical protein